MAYYGNPMSKRMGILGEIKPDSMLARLAKQAAAYAAVDSARPVLPALELIATVAQAGPGKSGLYRARMPDTLIERVMGWAEAHHYLVILDIQTGRSTVAAEMRAAHEVSRAPVRASRARSRVLDRHERRFRER